MRFITISAIVAGAAVATAQSTLTLTTTTTQTRTVTRCDPAVSNCPARSATNDITTSSVTSWTVEATSTESTTVETSSAVKSTQNPIWTVSNTTSIAGTGTGAPPTTITRPTESGALTGTGTGSGVATSTPSNGAANDIAPPGVIVAAVAAALAIAF